MIENLGLGLGVDSVIGDLDWLWILGIMIGDLGLGLRFGSGIGDWGLGIGIGDWRLGLETRIGHWD